MSICKSIRIFLALLTLAVVSATSAAPDYSNYEVEDVLEFTIKKFPVDHQGPQVIDVTASFTFRESITQKEYPDFEVMFEDLKTWMTEYPNETDYWEVFNRALCKEFLDNYPMVEEVELEIYVYPTYGIQYPHTSICAMERKPTKLIMQLDLGVMNAQFAGLIWAEEQGWFDEAGLDLDIRRFPKEGAFVPTISESDMTIGSIESGLFLSARAAGEPIIAVGTMFQASPLGLISMAETGIASPEDLIGKKVAIHGDGYEAFMTMLTTEGIDPANVELVKADYGNGPLIAGEVDAKQGYYVDELVKLQTEGYDANVIKYADHGHAAYSQLLFVSEAFLEKNRDGLIRFLQVADRGWKAAMANKAEVARIIVTDYEPQLSYEYQFESAKLIEDLVWAETKVTSTISPETLAANRASFLRFNPENAIGPVDEWADFTIVPEAMGK